MIEDKYFVRELKAKVELVDFVFTLMSKYDLDICSLQDIISTFAEDLSEEIAKEMD